jgi:Ca2+-binding EF-hand superfamily protein
MSMIDGREVPTITREQVLKFPELAHNPLRYRIVDVLKINDVLTFDELVDSLQKFSVNYPKPEKIKCELINYNLSSNSSMILVAFEIYDFDGDQLISREDLAQFLGVILNANVCEQQDLTPQDLDIVLDCTLAEMSTSKDGFVTMEQFKRIVDYENDIVHKFSIDF